MAGSTSTALWTSPAGTSVDHGVCFSATVKADRDIRVEVYIDDWYQASLILSPSNETGSVSIPPVTGKHTLTLKFFGDFSAASLSEFVFSRG